MHPEKQGLVNAGSITEGLITDVQNGADITWITVDHVGTGLPNKYGVVPVVGDHARIVTKGFSHVVGIDINGVEVFFKTQAELDKEAAEREITRVQHAKEKFLMEKEKLDADYAKLPRNFQRRLDIFRETNSDFRWEFEGYEMYTCKEALKIAAHLKDTYDLHYPLNRATLGEMVEEFRALKFDEQVRIAELDGDHSGNTMSCALLLAQAHLVDSYTIDDDSYESWVVAQHGALVPLVGCDEYGCPHPRP